MYVRTCDAMQCTCVCDAMETSRALVYSSATWIIMLHSENEVMTIYIQRVSLNITLNAVRVFIQPNYLVR